MRAWWRSLLAAVVSLGLALAVVIGLVVRQGGGRIGPAPPRNAGVAEVHEKWTAGACYQSGRCPEQGTAAARKIVLLGLRSNQRFTAPTDHRGNAVFRVAPGRYEARFPQAFTNHACDAGAGVARIRVRPHATTYAEIVCTDP